MTLETSRMQPEKRAKRAIRNLDLDEALDCNRSQSSMYYLEITKILHNGSATLPNGREIDRRIGREFAVIQSAKRAFKQRVERIRNNLKNNVPL